MVNKYDRLAIPQSLFSGLGSCVFTCRHVHIDKQCLLSGYDNVD